ncbi:PulJ/GspJ family protein [Aliagarivorans marinus]|uniref:PulJ/GspJ family protein n=1 Tax=Aliagarivorans marinus TaxID=561965 RepID=UPI0004144932|nr:prepilin-type N-terminal cleavage/methylation domain-containing protein [Aliagarivorans marinus]
MRYFRRSEQGFTLVELVITIVLLGVLAIATADFIRSGALIFRRGADQQQLVGEARFAIARINRDLVNALPNSALVTDLAGNRAQPGQGGPCLTFVPTQSSGSYIDLPISPSSTSSFTIVRSFDDSSSANIAVYVLDSSEAICDDGSGAPNSLCDGSGQKVQSVSSVAPVDDLPRDPDDALRTVTLSAAGSFPAASPSQRYYFVGAPVRYCIRNNQLLRVAPASFNLDDDGVAISNQIDTQRVSQFIVESPSLTRNGLINVRLSFLDADEYMEFNYDLSVANQP